VETDDVSIANLVAEHFLERGFEHFGYLGDDHFNWSLLRRGAFVEAIAKRGFTCQIYENPSQLNTPSRWDLNADDVHRWLSELPKPVGIMAAWDGFGQQLLEVCREHDVSVPDEVAVVGVDNDDVICELSEPPLSSVASDPIRTGYEAARILDCMIKGEKIAGGLRVIRPLGIVTRQSSDVLAIRDRQITEAVRFIRKHACDGIAVQDVVDVLGISRRVLETRFRKLFDRSPHQEIVRVRLQRVKQLLTETNLTLTAICERAGFQHMEHLSLVFKRDIGLPPGEYRRQFRRQIANQIVR
jgi:LacI family transcriptional regulator